MTQVLVQPCGHPVSLRHYEDTVLRPVRIDDVRGLLKADLIEELESRFPDGAAPMWGLIDNSNASWDFIEPGDIALFCGGNRVFAVGTVALKFKNKALADRLWGKNAEGRSYSRMYALHSVVDVNIPYEHFNRIVGYKPNALPQSFRILNQEKSARVLNDPAFKINPLPEREPSERRAVGPYAQAAAKLNVDEHVVESWVDILRRKRQVIFSGPPGTGKTFVAQTLARLLVDEPSRVEVVQFHPSYGYEDFIEGLRPLPLEGGGFEFAAVKGVVPRIAQSVEDVASTHVLIIDEINRANIPRVFGEMMFLLEYREKSMRLMLGGDEFQLPDDLLFIGTMNTADRSIRTIDVAMRRRFRFVDLRPSSDVLRRHYAKDENSNSLGDTLFIGFERLNSRLTDDIDRHHTVGHSFFMAESMDAKALREVWEYEIHPLIDEYFFDEPQKTSDYTFEGFWPGV